MTREWRGPSIAHERPRKRVRLMHLLFAPLPRAAPRLSSTRRWRLMRLRSVRGNGSSVRRSTVATHLPKRGRPSATRAFSAQSASARSSSFGFAPVAWPSDARASVPSKHGLRRDAQPTRIKMRVDPVGTGSPAGEAPAEQSRIRGSRFRVVLRKSRRVARNPWRPSEPPPPLALPFAVVPHRADATTGFAPPRGLERVARADGALLAAPNVNGLRATLGVTAHGAVDLTVRAGGDGVLISMAAAPILAERLAAASGTLGRKLSHLALRARSIRVTSAAGESEPGSGGAER